MMKSTPTNSPDRATDPGARTADGTNPGASSGIPTGTWRRQLSHTRTISQATINRLATPKSVTPRRHRSISPAKSSPFTKLPESPRSEPADADTGSVQADPLREGAGVGNDIQSTLQKFEALQVGSYGMTLSQLKNLIFEKCMVEGCWLVPELSKEDGFEVPRRLSGAWAPQSC